MGGELGDDLGDDFRQAVEEMEAGGAPGDTEDAAGSEGPDADGAV
jgi:hypothetical protein